LTCIPAFDGNNSPLGFVAGKIFYLDLGGKNLLPGFGWQKFVTWIWVAKICYLDLGGKRLLPGFVGKRLLPAFGGLSSQPEFGGSWIC
jgi:hypothetical protein